MILALAVTALLAGPTALAFFSGGYFDAARLAAAAGAWLLLAVAAVVSPAPLPRSLPGRLALFGLLGLTAWTAISFAWAPLEASVTDALQRDLLYLGALAAAAALLRPALARRAVEPALAAGVLIVVIYGLSERLLPGVIHLARSAKAYGRLEQPLTYWNAMGALAAVGAVLCARLGGDSSRPPWMRAAAAAGVVPLAVGVWLSYSRGAQAALAIGTLALLALSPTRAQLRAVAVAVVTGVPAVVAANAFKGVRGLEGSLSARESDGLAMLAILVALSAGAAAAVWLSARRERAGRWDAAAPRLPGWAPLAATLGVVLAAAIVVGFAAKSGGHAAASGATASRLVSLESNRYDYWKVAIQHGFEAQPLRGTGPGGFQVQWTQRRAIGERVHFAHSLYIGTLAELGLAGFAFLAAFLAGIGWAARRAQRAAPVLAAGPIAGLVVWLVHSAVDWDWEMPALTLVAIVLAGLLVGLADDRPAAAAESATAPGTVSRSEPVPA